MDTDRGADPRPDHDLPSLGEMFSRCFATDGARPAIIDGITTLTYDDLRRRVGQTLAVFDAMGIGRGTRIGLVAPMSAELLVTYMAAHIAGCCTTEFSTQPVERVAELVTSARLQVVVLDTGRQPAAIRLVEELDVPVLSFGATAGATDLLALAHQQEPADVTPRAPGPHSGLLFTSGTTGSPKKVLLRPGAAGAAVVMAMATTRWPDAPRTLATSPNFLVINLMVVPTLLRGGCIVVPESLTTDSLITTAIEHRVNVMFLLTFLIYAVLDDPRVRQLGRGQISLLLYGGEPILPARLAEGIEIFGNVFVNTYGQSETSTLTNLAPLDHDLDRPHLLRSVGRPLVGVQLEIRDADGQPLDPGEVGEIWARTPAAMDGYEDQPAKTAAAVRDGYVLTGDVGHLDSLGYLYLSDRAAYTFRSEGAEVYPREVAHRISEHPDVAQAAVVGVPDDRLGHRVCAAVVARVGTAPVPEDLIAFASSGERVAVAPHDVRLVDSLPRTAAGKVDTGVLHELFAIRAEVGS